MTAHEIHATYCRCGSANNADVEAWMACPVCQRREGPITFGECCAAHRQQAVVGVTVTEAKWESYG